VLRSCSLRAAEAAARSTGSERSVRSEPLGCVPRVGEGLEGKRPAAGG
jgi:hypothetical protein